MKKLLIIAFVLTMSSTGIISCTDEQIAPAATNPPGSNSAEPKP